MKLDRKKRYLQIALNSTLSDARRIIGNLPQSDRIIIEAGTPLIKRYGERGIRKVRQWFELHLQGQSLEMSHQNRKQVTFAEAWKMAKEQMAKQKRAKRNPFKSEETPEAYVVADLKAMDRGETEVDIAMRGGASAAVALGHAPIETLNAFVSACKERNLDSMIDMMHVDFPLAVLRELKQPPDVVILHRGVDETRFNKAAMLPLHEIRRIKGNYDVMISVAGGDTIKEVQSAVFNDADVVIVWKDFYRDSNKTSSIAQEFLDKVK